MFEERIDLEEVIRLVNAAREAAGLEAIDDLPKSRHGAARNPLCLALDCLIIGGIALMSQPQARNFASAWGVHVVPVPKTAVYTCPVPDALAVFRRQFDEGLFPEYIAPTPVIESAANYSMNELENLVVVARLDDDDGCVHYGIWYGARTDVVPFYGGPQPEEGLQTSGHPLGYFRFSDGTGEKLPDLHRPSANRELRTDIPTIGVHEPGCIKEASG